MTCLEDGKHFEIFIHNKVVIDKNVVLFKIQCNGRHFNISYRMDRSPRASEKLPCNICSRFEDNFGMGSSYQKKYVYSS